jgi:hypothetical protein
MPIPSRSDDVFTIGCEREFLGIEHAVFGEFGESVFVTYSCSVQVEDHEGSAVGYRDELVVGGEGDGIRGAAEGKFACGAAFEVVVDAEEANL